MAVPSFHRTIPAKPNTSALSLSLIQATEISPLTILKQVLFLPRHAINTAASYEPGASLILVLHKV